MAEHDGRDLTEFLDDPRRHLFIDPAGKGECVTCRCSETEHIATLAEWEAMEPDRRARVVWDRPVGESGRG